MRTVLLVTGATAAYVGFAVLVGNMLRRLRELEEKDGVLDILDQKTLDPPRLERMWEPENWFAGIPIYDRNKVIYPTVTP